MARRSPRVNGILNNEHGTSVKITNGNAQTLTLGTFPNHNDERANLHMTPAPNSTLPSMGNAGARNIVSRVPLPAKHPAQNHHQLLSYEYDFLNMSRMSLRRVSFSLRFSDGTLLPAIGHISFSILFAIIE